MSGGSARGLTPTLRRIQGRRLNGPSQFGRQRADGPTSANGRRSAARRNSRIPRIRYGPRAAVASCRWLATPLPPRPDARARTRRNRTRTCARGLSTAELREPLIPRRSGEPSSQLRQGVGLGVGRPIGPSRPGRPGGCPDSHPPVGRRLPDRHNLRIEQSATGRQRRSHADDAPPASDGRRRRAQLPVREAFQSCSLVSGVSRSRSQAARLVVNAGP